MIYIISGKTHSGFWSMCRFCKCFATRKMQESSVAADFADRLWCPHLPPAPHRHHLLTVQYQRQSQRTSTINI